MGEPRACAASGSRLRRGERAGKRESSPAVQVLGAQPSILGASCVGRTWAWREPRMGLQEDHAGRTILSGITRKVVTAVSLPPQV